MSTRHKKDDAGISENRYMSSVEFSDLRGINGVAVSARTAILTQQSEREFIWFIQALSLTDGGLRRVARQLLEMFPERIGTPKMHKAGVAPGKYSDWKLANAVEVELGEREYILEDLESAPQKSDSLIKLCKQAALSRNERQSDPLPCRPFSIEKFLTDLCINPRLSFNLPGQTKNSLESELAMEKNPELEERDFARADLIYFRDIIGALAEYKRRYEKRVRESFQLTAIGKRIWETLDYAAASRGMVVLDGLEGRGKTEAVKAWCELHLGAARFVSLKGISNKTTAFREISKALGIASSYTRTATEMQARIEDVLKRSRLLLVIDEAHFLFNQSRRMYSRPELIDWIDTAICNQGIGCALVTTPQFLVCMSRAADQVEWNFRQFRRRVRRWVLLPKYNTESDIFAVARAVFKNSTEAAIKKIVGYAFYSKRDLSAIGDLAMEIRVMRGKDDLSGVSVDEVCAVLNESLNPSDKAFEEGMKVSSTRSSKGYRKPADRAILSAGPRQDEFDRPSGDLQLTRARLVEPSRIEA